MESVNLSKIARKFSNDYDLGEYLNLHYKDDLNNSELSELVKNNPNYYQLGELVRSIVHKKLNS